MMENKKGSSFRENIIPDLSPPPKHTYKRERERGYMNKLNKCLKSIYHTEGSVFQPCLSDKVVTTCIVDKVGEDPVSLEETTPPLHCVVALARKVKLELDITLVAHQRISIDPEK